MADTYPILDETPRHRRITFTGPNGAKGAYIGRVTRTGDKIRGETRTDAKGGGVTLHVFFGVAHDIVTVEGLHPRYDQWVRLPWPADTFTWDGLE